MIDDFFRLLLKFHLLRYSHNLLFHHLVLINGTEAGDLQRRWCFFCFCSFLDFIVGLVEINNLLACVWGLLRPAWWIRNKSSTLISWIYCLAWNINTLGSSCLLIDLLLLGCVYGCLSLDVGSRVILWMGYKWKNKSFLFTLQILYICNTTNDSDLKFFISKVLELLKTD